MAPIIEAIECPVHYFWVQKRDPSQPAADQIAWCGAAVGTEDRLEHAR